MKKINITGMIADMTIAAATMAVPAIAQTQITEAQAKKIDYDIDAKTGRVVDYEADIDD
jgi:predicted small secreted protein